MKLTDPNRFGLLGHGSILSLTSVATRTSPVYRGKYVLSTFLNTPPPPPLPNVPTLEESNKENAPKTVREQLERHRTPVVCASCHRVIDPPGFALENFNSVGQWRTKGDGGAAIDSGGVLADGTKVDGPVALRNAILARPDAFATVLTERLMTYALGRGVEPSDMPVVRAIVRKAALDNYRLASIVQGIIDSAPFQMRTKLEPAGTSTTVARATATRLHGAAMIITKKHLSRRTFLQGTFGAAVALPFLDAMVPALTAQSQTAAAAPFRFGVIYMPCGVYPETWHPTHGRRELRVQAGDAAGRAVPRSARDDQQAEGAVGRVGPRGGQLGVPQRRRPRRVARRAPATRSTSCGRRRRSTSTSPTRWPATRRCGRSRSAPRTWAPSAGACDGFPCTMFETLAWREDTRPLPVSINPRVTFERMFGEIGSPQFRQARLKEKQSLLDSMTAETSKLRGSLGAADKAILDEYLSNIRQVEGQLDRMETRLGTLTGNPDAPIGLPEAFDDHMSVTYDLMHLALQGDISRVFTFMIGHEPTDRSYAHIGVPETHHSISHHGNDAEKLAKYAKIGTYQMVKFAEFLEKVKNTKDGDGNLLDHSLFYWGSGMSNGNLHDRSNPPTLLVGGAHGRLKGNRHIVAKEEPTANLLLALGHIAGVEVEKFGASTGRLDL